MAGQNLAPVRNDLAQNAGYIGKAFLQALRCQWIVPFEWLLRDWVGAVGELVEVLLCVLHGFKLCHDAGHPFHTNVGFM